MGYLKKRGNAIKIACSGLFEAIRKEPHMQLHVISALLAFGASWYLNLSAMEWVAVTLCVVFVMVTELINTAIERTCNLITKEKNEDIRYIKDISAGLVLLACLGALVIGLIIFLPKVIGICN